MSDQQNNVDINIRAKALLGDAQAQISKFLKEIEDTTESSTQKASGSWMNMFTAMAGGAAVGTALERAFEKTLGLLKSIPEEIVGLGERGSKVLGVEQAFNRLTESVGGSEAVLAALRNGVKGTIGDFDLMVNANKLIADGAKMSTADFGTMAAGARLLAKETGKTTVEAMDLLSQAMATGKTKALNLIDVHVNADAAMDRYSKTIGKSVTDFTNQDKVAANAAETLRQLKQRVDEAGDSQLTFGEKITAAKVKLENIEDEVGKAIASSPVLAAGMDAAGKAMASAFGGDKSALIKTIVGWIETGAIYLIDFAQAGVTAGKFLTQAFYGTRAIFFDVLSAITGVSVSIGETIDSLLQMGENLPVVGSKFKAMRTENESFIVGLKGIQKSFKDTADGAVDDAAKMGSGLDTVWNGLDKVKASMLAAQNQTAKTSDATKEHTRSLGDQNEAFEKANKDHKAFEDSLRKLTDNIAEAAREHISLAEQVKLYGKAALDAADKGEAMGIRVGASVKALAEAYRATELAKIVAELMKTANDEWTKGLKATEALHQEELSKLGLNYKTLTETVTKVSNDIALARKVGIDKELTDLDQKYAEEIKKLGPNADQYRQHYNIILKAKQDALGLELQNIETARAAEIAKLGPVPKEYSAAYEKAATLTQQQYDRMSTAAKQRVQDEIDKLGPVPDVYADTYTKVTAEMEVQNEQQRGIITKTADTLVERMAAAGIKTKALLKEEADGARTDFEQMRASGKFTAEELEAAWQKWHDTDKLARGEVLTGWLKAFSEMNAAVSQFGDLAGGTLGTIAASAGGAMAALVAGAAAQKNLEYVRQKYQDGEASGIQVGAAYATTIMTGAKAMLTAADNIDRTKAALGAMNAGMQTGMAIAGPWGAAIGAAVGLIVGIFKKNIAAEAMKDIGQNWGVNISEGLAKQIEADNKRLGDRVAAQLTNLGKVIAEAGGIGAFGLDKALGKARDLFIEISRGKLTAAEAGKTFDQVFGEALPLSIDKSTGMLSEKMLELIKLNDQFGTNSANVATFIQQQMSTSLAGLTTYADNATLTSQSAADGVTEAIAAVFAQTKQQTGSTLKAIEAVGPVASKLQAQLTAAGLSGTGAFSDISRWAGMMQDAVTGKAVKAMDGLGQALAGLTNTGLVTQSMAAGLGTAFSDSFNKAKAAGADENDLMMLNAGTIQSLIELQDRYGYTYDDNTQKIIDNAKEAGIAGEEHKSANERMVDSLKRVGDTLDRIADKLGAGLPAAARTAADGVNDALARIKDPNVTVRYTTQQTDGSPSADDGGGDNSVPVPGAAAGGLYSKPTFRVIAESQPEVVGSPSVIVNALAEAMRQTGSGAPGGNGSAGSTVQFNLTTPLATIDTVRQMVYDEIGPRILDWLAGNNRGSLTQLRNMVKADG